MALNGDELGQEIVDTINLDGLGQPEQDALLASWQAIGNAIVDHIKANAELDDAKLSQSLNTIFSNGVPVPQDGGTALKTAWTANTSGGAKDGVEGGIK